MIGSNMPSGELAQMSLGLIAIASDKENFQSLTAQLDVRWFKDVGDFLEILEKSGSPKTMQNA